MKVWYFICILFALHSINILIEEGSKITYVTSDDEENELNYLLVCIDLKQIFSNKTTIDLQQLDENAYAYFGNYFSEDIDRIYKKKQERIKKEFKIKVNEKIVNLIKAKIYFVLRDQFCIILDKYNLNYKLVILIYSKNPKHYIFKNDTYDLLKLNTRFEKFDQTIVINKENSNCVKYYSKLKCLNQCYKRKNRLSKYIYNSNEDGIIYIDFEYNSRIKQDENDCLNECKRNECKLIHFKTIETSDSETKVFEAAFLVSNFDYYFQLIGLIFLIVNISFYQLILGLILLLNLKTEKLRKRIKKLKIIKKVLMTIRRIKKVKIAKKLGTLMIKIEKYFNLTKTMILLIGLAYFLNYSTTTIENRNYLMKNPKEYETETYLVKPEILNLVVCTVFKGITREHYRKKTLLELEKATDRGFNDTISEIYLQFQNKKSEIDWKLKKNKVFFREYGFDQTMSRCFQIEIYPHEPKYQSLFATSKLRIEFKHNDYELYLISKDENFNQESYEIDENFSFMKKIEKRLKSNENEKCLDYKEAYSYCYSRQNCIDRCSSVKFVEKYKNASFDAIIDKEHFTADQWNNSFINDSENYFKIREECEMEFQIKNCGEIVFEDNSQFNKPEDKIKEIDLYYYVIRKEDEESSFYKLGTDILNMQSVLFGQNVFNLLMMVYYLLKIRLKVKGCKYYLFLIFLICLSGSIYHFYLILDQVANGKLIYFVYYNIETSMKMSEIIFCFDFDLSHRRINKNYKLTENYLDELSKEIKIKSVFEKVEYLNDKSNEWISLKTPNFENLEFKIETFYFLNKKCFKVKQDIEYDRDQLKLLDNNDVLKINFNRTFIIQKDLNIYFFTKISNMTQFSRIKNLVLFSGRIELIYSINQKSVEQQYSLFNLIQNPFSFYDDKDDANSYFINLMNDFEQNKKLRSLKLPLERIKSNKEIDDDLFEQHYKKIENTDHKSTKSLNSQKLFITNTVKIEKSLAYSNPDFRFELNFLKNRILITNEDNFLKLILNLLNVLSLWADLCILDLYVYVYYAYNKTVFIFITFHRLLIRIHTFLFENVYC